MFNVDIDFFKFENICGLFMLNGLYWDCYQKDFYYFQNQKYRLLL
jgi:hypothetical protein